MKVLFFKSYFMDPKRLFYRFRLAAPTRFLKENSFAECFEGQSDILHQLHAQYFETVIVFCSYA